MMLQNGTDVCTLSAMLGHYDAGFTLRTCSHTTMKQQEQIGAPLAEELRGGQRLSRIGQKRELRKLYSGSSLLC